MKQNLLLFGMLFVMVAVSVAAADGPTGKTSTSAPLTTNGLRQQVIAYYFHGTHLLAEDVDAVVADAERRWVAALGTSS